MKAATAMDTEVSSEFPGSQCEKGKMEHAVSHTLLPSEGKCAHVSETTIFWRNF